jgi:hypothetical protein
MIVLHSIQVNKCLEAKKLHIVLNILYYVKCESPGKSVSFIASKPVRAIGILIDNVSSVNYKGNFILPFLHIAASLSP